MFRLLARTATAALLLFALNACYVTERSVLPASLAEEIPGIEGLWTVVDGDASDTLLVERIPNSNEYQLTATQEDEKLTMHGFKLAGDIVVLEIYDQAATEDGAIIAFVQISGDTLSVLTPAGDSSMLASQAGVQLGEDAVEVFGEPSAVLQFVQLHADTAFAPPQPMMTRVK